MNSKLAAVIGAGVLLAAIVIIVLVSQGGSPDNTDLAKEPVIEAETGDPPTELESRTSSRARRRAKSGDTLSVQYVGASPTPARMFDSSWDGEQPFEFPLGAGQVIPGWDQGLEGMKAGGRRELMIPGDLAYGAAGSPPASARTRRWSSSSTSRRCTPARAPGATAIPGATAPPAGSTDVPSG